MAMADSSLAKLSSLTEKVNKYYPSDSLNKRALFIAHALKEAPSIQEVFWYFTLKYDQTFKGHQDL